MNGQNSIALEKALRLRKRLKRSKPDFVRHESWRYDRLKENWRRPRGIDNKMRRKIKGWPSTVNVGYRGPKASRSIHPSGYEEVLVHNAEELNTINPETQAVRIAHTVGKKKRTLILVEARKKKIVVLNPGELKEEAKPEKEQVTEKTEEKEGKEEKPKEKEKPEAEQKERTKPEEGKGSGQS